MSCTTMLFLESCFGDPDSNHAPPRRCLLHANKQLANPTPPTLNPTRPRVTQSIKGRLHVVHSVACGPLGGS